MQDQNTYNSSSERQHPWLLQEGWLMLVFYTEWSGSSLMMKSVTAKVISEMSQPMQRHFVDMDAEPGIAEGFHIQRVPTLLVFRDGVLQASFPGIVSQQRLKDQLQALFHNQENTK